MDSSTTTTPEGFRWAACTKYESETAARHRHLIRRGREQLTSLCGNTASSPDLWKYNSAKKPCPACLGKMADR